ncbi:uncharacterized protein LOC132309095 [Cornus florida]|uniref:uncharacterized protein LOC132309095 n=1 Tax=Cornus florida TaxID=4283 RepID=UPI00289F4C72|nr:uncharacterized protein LOC132309095 [Cornus florida]
MRFPIEYGIGELRGDQTITRECYVASLKEKKQQEALIVEEIEEKEQDRAKPIEDLVEICLNDNDVTKKVRIGSLLPSATIEHRLNTDPTFKPIKQKRRTFVVKRNMAISEEVNKLLKADFIQEVNYPDWLANVVLVMPFGLKNAGLTYQRLVNLMFKNQIGRNMKVYVDDMLVKSLKAQDHIADLQETFQVLRKHQMKLNLDKCAFGVSSGKFLGYMVSRRGIEANLEKI